MEGSNGCEELVLGVEVREQGRDTSAIFQILTLFQGQMEANKAFRKGREMTYIL